jgi:hypothetical protein
MSWTISGLVNHKNLEIPGGLCYKNVVGLSYGMLNEKGGNL